MNTYQRGNRDGLLSFAIWLEERADEWQKEAKRLDTLIKKAGSAIEQHKMTVTNALFRAAAYREAATGARRQAESLPHDPEEFQAANREEPA
jgi:hypothetical protein